MKFFRIFIGLVAVIGVSACTQTKVKQEQYSGFLGDYSRLQPAKSAEGDPVIRWVSPDLRSKGYTQIMLDPVVLYPEPKTTAQVSEQALNSMTMTLEDNLRRELAKEVTLVSSPSPETMHVRIALTGVDISNKGFKPYEILPIALVAKGAILAAGKRTQEVALFLEMQVTDSQTDQLLAQVVRKSFGEDLSNKDKVLKQEDVNEVLNVWSKDLSSALHELK